MTDISALKKLFDESGMTFTAIASKANIERTTLYHRLNGVGEFTASEIVGLTRALGLSKRERDSIFFAN